jgi:anti-sigma regulatory factor (Ser/Thr protein kinase)
MSSLTLDYKLLDDLMFVRPEHLPAILPRLNGCAADAIGPAIEYAFCRTAASILPPVEELFPSPTSRVVAAALRHSSLPATTSTDPREIEVVRPPEDRVTNVYWKVFRRRFVNAAVASGFDTGTAKGLVGAFVEMVSNVGEHSGAADTALAGYRSHPGVFEFVIADRGRGVLDSLKTNPDYARLADPGQALQLALSSGESRHGHLIGRGMGFDTVFRSLAQLTGSLRFRSGDHSLEIDGQSPELIAARVRQRASYQGLLVSVVCRA